MVGVVGAGDFGLGLCRSAVACGNDVILWSRSKRSTSIDGVQLTHSIADLARAEILFIAVPSAHVEALCLNLGQYLDGRHFLVHVSRGLVGNDLTTITKVMRTATPCRRVGVLAGPLIASALLEAKPSSAVVGTTFPEVTAAVRDALSSNALRLYDTADVIGVELASAWVGVLAIVAGFAMDLGLSPATLATVLTRGIAEGARLGAVEGAAERTFAGLAGFGDLIAAVAGDDRPEIRAGRALARGEGGRALEESIDGNVEGLTLAGRLRDHGRRVGIEVPIASATAAVIAGRLTADAVIGDLMARDVTKE